MEFPYHMQEHLENKPRAIAQVDKESQKSEEQKRWEKAPAEDNEPSSSPRVAKMANQSKAAEGMAVAACPPVTAVGKTTTEPALPGDMKKSAPEDNVGIERKVSKNHVEKADQLDDITDQVVLEEGRRAAKPKVKPGILLNTQFDSELRQCKKVTTKEPEGERHYSKKDEDYQLSGDEEGPGEKMRKMTVRRNDQVGESDSEPSDESWGEIRSHLNRDPRNRPSREEPDRRGTENVIRLIQLDRAGNALTAVAVCLRRSLERQHVARQTSLNPPRRDIKTNTVVTYLRVFGRPSHGPPILRCR